MRRLFCALLIPVFALAAGIGLVSIAILFNAFFFDNSRFSWLALAEHLCVGFFACLAIAAAGGGCVRIIDYWFFP